MSEALFYVLITTRFVAPLILFYYVHPFYAMLLDEFVVDGIIAPHHLFRSFVPTEFNVFRKPHYDLPLDAWGFFNGLQPVICKGHKYYNVFDGYRTLILSLFV